jgi:hypothetical protein
VKIGVRYIVTKPSEDGTFGIGDCISKCSDGAIACWSSRSTPGWIDSEDADEAMLGVEVKLDSEWIERRKALYLAELAKLEGLE